MRAIRIGLIASFVVLGACSRAAEPGPQAQRDFPVGSFSKIEIAGPFNARVATGKAPSVRAAGPQNLIDRMEVEVKGDTLVVRPKRTGWFGNFSWSGPEAQVAITVPSLAGLEVAGSGDVEVDRISGERFAGAIAGSGNLRLSLVQVREIALEIAGSGGVTATGQASRATYEIAGSGDIDASALQAERADASIAGSGNIRARVSGEVDASIAGSGNIDVAGGAKCKSSKAGSGSITCS